MSLDTMQVQVQTHMHAHIWSGFVSAVYLEAFFSDGIGEGVQPQQKNRL